MRMAQGTHGAQNWYKCGEHDAIAAHICLENCFKSENLCQILVHILFWWLYSAQCSVDVISRQWWLL